MLKENYKELIPDMNSWLLPRENGMILSDYQVEILSRNGIDYRKYSTVKEILFEINDILDEEYNDELDLVAHELDERNYYSSKKN